MCCTPNYSMTRLNFVLFLSWAAAQSCQRGCKRPQMYMLCIKHTRKWFSHKDSQLEDQDVGKINRVYPTGRYDPLRFTQITLFEIFFHWIITKRIKHGGQKQKQVSLLHYKHWIWRVLLLKNWYSPNNEKTSCCVILSVTEIYLLNIF